MEIKNNVTQHSKPTDHVGKSSYGKNKSKKAVQSKNAAEIKSPILGDKFSKRYNS